VLEELGLASDKAITKGKQPADALKDNPDDLPPVGEDAKEEQKPTEQQPKKTPKKKPNN
jgi:outer membrane protein